MSLQKLSSKVNPNKNIYILLESRNKQDHLTELGAWCGRKREGRRRSRGEKGRSEDNLSAWDIQVGGRTEMRARDILIEGAIIGLARNLAL